MSSLDALRTAPIYAVLLDGPAPSRPASEVTCTVCGAGDLIVTSQRDGGPRCVRCCCQEIRESAWARTVLVLLEAREEARNG
jgi:hypothetical protein